MSTDPSTKDRILIAARQVFYQQGLAGARMAAIAEAAGINKAMLHYYFKTKQDLFDEVFIQAFAQFLPAAAQILMRPGPILDRMTAISTYYHETLLKTPELPVFVINALQSQGGVLIERVIERAGLPVPDLLQTLMGQLAEELEAGPYQAYDPRDLFINLIAMSVFPFMLKPFLVRLFRLSEADFSAFVQQRQTSVPAFLRQAITLPPAE